MTKAREDITNNPIEKFTALVPPEIAAAEIKVRMQIEKLPKSEDNTFAHYKFTSVDGFFEIVGPLLAEHGLKVEQEEARCEFIPAEGKGPGWVKIEFIYRIVHSSGVATEWSLPRTVMVQAQGAQAFGSAQSYSLKQWLRARFLIPTGDSDEIDTTYADNIPQPKKFTAPKVGPARGKPKDEWENYIETFQIAVQDQTTRGGLHKLINEDNAAILARLQKEKPKAHEMVMGVARTRYAELPEPQLVDLDDLNQVVEELRNE